MITMNDKGELVMTNADLIAGMLVELKNGRIGILIPVGKGKLEVYDEALNALSPAFLYTDASDMRSIEKDYAIVTVYDLTYRDCYDLFDAKYRNLLWKWKGPKELTVREIENILGYPIKIVK